VKLCRQLAGGIAVKVVDELFAAGWSGAGVSGAILFSDSDGLSSSPSLSAPLLPHATRSSVTIANMLKLIFSLFIFSPLRIPQLSSLRPSGMAIRQREFHCESGALAFFAFDAYLTLVSRAD